jgi:predicted DCC family thiol-disulfide oxidoreductase YuxK
VSADERHTSQPDRPTLAVIYDGDCPFCTTYVRHLRLRDAYGEVVLVNARDGGPFVDVAVGAGVDLDEGMALVIGDRVVHGADCVHQLALMSTRVGWFNRACAVVFSRPRLSRMLYPVIRLARNLVLRARGRPALVPPGEGTPPSPPASGR